MKIKRIDSKVIKVPFKAPVKVAFKTITAQEIVLLRIQTDTALEGFGEVSTIEEVTGETTADIMAFLKAVAPLLLGRETSAIETIHQIMTAFSVGHSAAKAGIDLALYDLLGKQAGLPLYRLLGGDNSTVKSDITLGIDTPEVMAMKAKNLVAAGFDELKLKVGIDDEADYTAVKAVREAVGPSINIKIDANQGWTVKQTLQMAARLEKYNIIAIEQPLPYWQLVDNRLIRAAMPQRLMLDESIHTPHDAIQAIRQDATDIINIKLMKSAGIFGAQAINSIAEASGVPCMIGCMAETRLGIAAALHFAAAKTNVHYVDLDSYLFFKETAYIRGGFEHEGGRYQLLEAPGIGVEINFEEV